MTYVQLADRWPDAGFAHLRCYRTTRVSPNAGGWPTFEIGGASSTVVSPATDWAALRATYDKVGIATAPRATPRAVVLALQDWYKTLLSVGMCAAGDRQDGRRMVCHSDPIGLALMDCMRPAAESVAGRGLRPNYSYFIAYQAGSALPMHVDHDGCLVTMGLVVAGFGQHWPLLVGENGRQVECLGREGDVAMFAGTSLPHQREATDTPFWVITLHYVAA